MANSIIFTTGEPGSGKSYVRCAYFVTEEFIPEKSGIHCSNFPINIEEVSRYCAQKYNMNDWEVESRLERIPPEVIESWRDRKNADGPWNYFKDRDVNRMHIALDECHEFISRSHPAEHRELWREWLAQIRHRGATIEFISQNPQQVAMEAIRLATKQIVMVNAYDDREPITGIRQGHLQEIWAKFVSGKYYEVCRQIEKRKSRKDQSKWVEKEAKLIVIHPKRFKLYDSYSAPREGEITGSGEKKEYEKRSWYGLLIWVVSYNSLPIAKRFIWIGGAAFLLYMGLSGAYMRMFVNVTQKVAMGIGSGGEQSDNSVAAQAASLQQPDPITREFTPPPGVSQSDAADIVAIQEGAQLDCCQQAEQLQQRIIQLTAEAAETERLLSEQLTSAERELERVYQISLITEDEVTFRNGYSYRVGEVIDAGTYKGRSVKSINWRRRAAELDDGTVIRMGSSIRPSDGDTSVSSGSASVVPASP